MNALSSRLGLLAVLLALLLPATVVAQNTWIVGGAGANYATLEALRLSGVLQDGDTIVLNGNDNSLTRAFGTNNLTFQGTGRISPAGDYWSARLSHSTGTVTLDSDSLGRVYTNLDLFCWNCYSSLWTGHKNNMTVLPICCRSNVAM